MCRCFLNNEKKRDESEKNANFSWNHYNWMIPTCLGIQARVFTVRCSHFVCLKREMKRAREKEKKKRYKWNWNIQFFFRSFWKIKTDSRLQWLESWFQFSLANFSGMNCKWSSFKHCKEFALTLFIC